MPRRLATTLLVLLALALAGPAGAKSLFVYVHDRGATNQVFGFTLDKKTGALAELPGSPFVGNDPGGGCGGFCQTLAWSKKRKLLVGSGPTGLSVWRVSESGALTLVPGSPFGALQDPLGTGIVEKGKRVFVYAAEFDADQVSGFEVQPGDTLAALPSSPFAAGFRPDGLVTTKKGVFVVNEGEGTVSSFAFQKDGSLVPAPGSPFFVSPFFVYNARPDPKGKFLYLPDDGNAVNVFSIDKKTAALTPTPSTPELLSILGYMTGVAVGKKFLVAFLFEDGFDDIEIQDRNKKTGALDFGSRGVFDSLIPIDAHALEPKEKYLLVASNGFLQSWSLDAKRQLFQFADEIEFGPGTEVNAVVVIKR